ncbi:hypothetical protein [Ottowia sp.]|uniref:hypothetical protein n=1 Tax=Ottowia sp. TaxID=1898956 RepID=UPI0025D78CEA|nr:hypothetical protein [Ottowia sp.]MBK6616147.1 hypothetical protein [Ottowia sp.]
MRATTWFPAALMTAIMAVGALLAGCGGDSADSGTPKADCPTGSQDAVWINGRLGCARVGDQFVKLSANSGGGRIDRAYAIAQIAYDKARLAPINGGKSRFFEYFLCVRGVPDRAVGTAIAGDLQNVLELGSTSRYMPNDIGLTALEADGSGQVAVPYVDEPCDPARHPVIVNYSTGQVESINRGALAALNIYDK